MRHPGKRKRPAALAVALLLAAAAGAHAREGDEFILRRRGLEAQPRSLSAYLRTLYPDQARREKARVYAAWLGESDATRRDEATLKLAALRAASVGELKTIVDSPDPEVRRVARRLLAEALRNVDKDLLLAVLRTIEEHRVPGLTHDLLQITPLGADLFILPTVHRALAATTRPSDLPLLRAYEADTIEIRCGAILALGAVIEAKRLPELHPLLRDEDDRVRAAAAWALANRGDRACLETFGALLDSDRLSVRRQAVRALRHIGATTLGYAAYASEPARRRQSAAWRDWLARNAATVRWTYPLPPVHYTLGRTLIALYSENRVVELDEFGRKIWEVAGLKTAWAVQGLSNGHRLIVLYSERTIVEYNANGKEIWRHRLRDGHPGSVRRLDNGNTLVSVSNSPGTILELRPDGTVAREVRVSGRPTDAQPLRNGNLLVCLSQKKRIVELDRTGREVWSLQGFKNPYSARRLDNGNTLVTDFGAGKVSEFDRSGKVVWEIAQLKQCYGAERLANGRTLIADTDGVREIDRDGTAHWLYRGSTFMRATRY